MRTKIDQAVYFLHKAVSLFARTGRFFRPGNAKSLYFRYEKYFSPLALLAGFVVDSLTLRRIDLWAENLVIISYLLLALLAIIYLSGFEAGALKKRFLIRLAKFTPYILQFVFGGLFSAFFVFYNRSASLAASWPFLLVILGLLIGNEAFRLRYQRLAFRLCIYFMALFSYAVFAVPLLLSRIGPWVFVMSGLAAWLALLLALYLVYLAAPDVVRKSRHALLAGTAIIFFFFNALYFLGYIPPIPLAVKESGVYHRLTRTAEGYRAAYEPPPWYLFWRGFDPVYDWDGGRIYHFTAVFAPADFGLPIYHHWQYYDQEREGWISSDLLGFPISGGREGGYRGYSYKQSVMPGRWRIDTVTEGGRIMGRTAFRIRKADESPELRLKNL